MSTSYKFKSLTYNQTSRNKYVCTWSDNKVRELNAVIVLQMSLLNVTVVAFKVLPLGNYAPMPAPSPPFKTVLELVLCNGLQCRRCITPDHQCHQKASLNLWEHKKSQWGVHPGNWENVPAHLRFS
jgi:hypothetical protein